MRHRFCTPFVLAALTLCFAGCDSFPPGPPGDRDGDGIPDGADPEPSTPNSLALNHGGRARTYYLRIPGAYTAATPLPLVVVLHATGQTASEIRGLTRFDRLADSEGFLAVFPEAIGLNWNDGRAVPGIPAYDENIDDVGFINALIEALGATFAVDRARVYLAGMSNGGIMAYRLAHETPLAFAAVAPVLAAIPVNLGALPPPAAPVPMCIINSTTDPILPYEGGEVFDGPASLGIFASVEDSVAFWVQQNGSLTPPETVELPDSAPLDGTRVTRITYPAGNAEVLFYRIQGAGHSWPGGPLLQIFLSPPVCYDIDATAEIWAFFNRHAR